MIGDDIYITGHLGDSFIGLQILKKKISIPKLLKNYFISKFYMPSINFTNGSYHAKFHLNMGLGFFGTTAVSSAQNPDDGIGIFEYDVPAGYRALCTKSLNAQEYS